MEYLCHRTAQIFTFRCLFIDLFIQSRIPNKCKTTSITNLSNLSWTHHFKPIINFIWQLRNTFILACSHYYYSIWDSCNEFFHSIRWNVRIKHFGHFDFAIHLIYNYYVKASVVAVYVWFHLYRFAVYDDFSKVASIVSGWFDLYYQNKLFQFILNLFGQLIILGIVLQDSCNEFLYPRLVSSQL